MIKTNLNLLWSLAIFDCLIKICKLINWASITKKLINSIINN